MAKIRNISPDERSIPSLRVTVPPDGAVEVSDEQALGFAGQTDLWQVTGVDIPEGIPPRRGGGSGRDAWAAYAAIHGVTAEEGDTRDDIIARLDAAGVPTGGE